MAATMNVMAEQNTNAEGVPTGEAELVKKWMRRIERTRKDDGAQLKRIRRWRKYLEGRADGDGEVLLNDGDDEATADAGMVRCNIVHSTMQGLMPHIYADNPEVSIAPKEATPPSLYELVRGFAKTAEILLNYYFYADANQMKRVGKRCVRGAMSASVGWLKMSYQRDYRTDPLILERINDAQDNLARIELLLTQTTEEGGSGGEQEAKREELRLQIEALQAQAEVVVSEGLKFDFVLTDDVLFDPGIVEIEDYRRADWFAHGVWMGVDEARAVFKLTKEELQRVKTYANREAGGGTANAVRSVSEDIEVDEAALVRVHEIWHRGSQTVYTLLEGLTRWAKPPYQPHCTGRQWFCLYPLYFNPVDARRWPLSDVELLTKLQEEYNSTREKFVQHRERVVPATLVRGDDYEPDELTRISQRKTQEVIAVKGPEDPTVPLQNTIAEVPSAKIDPALYDTTIILHDINMVSGLPDAERANLVQPKTATEADYLRQGLISRTGERRDAVEDWMSNIAADAVQILLLELSLPQVQRIAGPSAVWPQLMHDEIYDLVQFKIRAGSSGRPNKQREQQNWLQLLPVVQQFMSQIYQALMTGQLPVAHGMVQLLREGLRRFDERIDIESLIPLPPMQGQLPGAGLPPLQGPTMVQPGSRPAPAMAPLQMPSVTPPPGPPPVGIGDVANNVVPIMRIT